jgi:hypothetical protein
MKKINEMKRNELMNELKNLEIKFDSKMKNEELMNLLEDSIIKSFNLESRKNDDLKDDSKKENKISFLEKINSDSMKSNNFQEIHEKYMNESEISMIDSLEKISINEINIKEFLKDENNLKSFNENFEFIMIHKESRKIYYLFLYDKKNDKEIFIMKNDSIMKNKIYLLKFSQFFEIDSLKIHYIKNDRKNQSKEIIDRNSKDYEDKIKKYSMI